MFTNAKYSGRTVLGSACPFTLSDAAVCDVPLNVNFSLLNVSGFYKQANAVKMTGDYLTNEQKAIAGSALRDRERVKEDNYWQTVRTECRPTAA